MYDLVSIGKAAKSASFELMNLDSGKKSSALCAIADVLIKNTDEIKAKSKNRFFSFKSILFT